MVPERNNNYTFIIEVDCDEGEENISITEISLDELNQVNPLLFRHKRKSRILSNRRFLGVS